MYESIATIMVSKKAIESVEGSPRKALKASVQAGEFVVLGGSTIGSADEGTVEIRSQDLVRKYSTPQQSLNRGRTMC